MPKRNLRNEGNRDVQDEREIDSFRASTTRWLFGSFAGWATLALCVVAIGVFIIAAKWLRNIGTRYKLTDQRLIVRTGILLKREDEIELFRVKDIRVDYSLINQLVDIGTITLRSSDTTTRGGDFSLENIPQARRRREVLRTLVDDARQRRGVREVDYDRERY